MNIIIGIISLIITFSSLVLIEKIFKKEGLYAWITFAIITANILVCKNIKILGLTVTLGNILFASNFLATDIMAEKYSSNDSKKAVTMAVIFQILFIISTSLGIAYRPSPDDLSNNSMKNLFSINYRVSISSILMLYLSNMLDIYLFDKIRKKFPKQLWLRNNVSTIISNCLENYFFVFFAFIGIYDLKTIFIIASTTSIIEIVIAICDTPFLYLAKMENIKRTKI